MKNALKRILGVVLTTFLAVSSLSVTMPISAYSDEEPTLPSVTQFATRQDLTNPDNFTLHTCYGSGVAQKVNFGTGKTWYIAGEDKDGSLVLMCDPTAPLDSSGFGGNSKYTISSVRNKFYFMSFDCFSYA